MSACGPRCRNTCTDGCRGQRFPRVRVCRRGGNNIAVSNGRTIALCGVKDLVIVETADAILVCHRDAVQDIKKIVQQLPKELT
jgi:hypothetical protein